MYYVIEGDEITERFLFEEDAVNYAVNETIRLYEETGCPPYMLGIRVMREIEW